MYYSAGWQLLPEDVAEGYIASATIDRVCQSFWGLRYIDDIVMRRTYTAGDAGGESERVFFHLTDAQFSTVAVVDSIATLVERTAYDPYGRARHQWAEDVNGDGVVDVDDENAIDAADGTVIGDSLYEPDADIDRDGNVDGDDLARVPGGGRAALPPGAVGNPTTLAAGDRPDGPDSPFGYCGYVHNPEVDLYTVRFRHYHPTLGRWIESDNAGYVDGSSLYCYVRERATSAIDPFGECGGYPDDFMLHPYDRGGPHFQRQVSGQSQRWCIYTLQPLEKATPALSKTDIDQLLARFGKQLSQSHPKSAIGYTYRMLQDLIGEELANEVRRRGTKCLTGQQQKDAIQRALARANQNASEIVTKYGSKRGLLQALRTVGGAAIKLSAIGFAYVFFDNRTENGLAHACMDIGIPIDLATAAMEAAQESVSDLVDDCQYQLRLLTLSRAGMSNKDARDMLRQLIRESSKNCPCPDTNKPGSKPAGPDQRK